MILAKGKIAKKPYELSYLGQNIYSIEELCYVIYHNIYGINEEFFQISLAKWMKEERGLKELADNNYIIMEYKHRFQRKIYINKEKFTSDLLENFF